jgi:hypothetical protein
MHSQHGGILLLATKFETLIEKKNFIFVSDDNSFPLFQYR